MMDALKVILERRSIRKFRTVPVPDEVLEEIVTAGTYAPSGINLQPWYFVVVRTPEKMSQVRALMAIVALKFNPILKEHFRGRPEIIEQTNNFMVTLGNAPACVLVYANKKNDGDRDNVIESISAAIQNMQLAAWNRGVGSCWIGAPNHVDCGGLFEAAFASDRGEFVAALALGYPDEDPKAPKRKSGRYTFI